MILSEFEFWVGTPKEGLTKSRFNKGFNFQADTECIREMVQNKAEGDQGKTTEDRRGDTTQRDRKLSM